jgi:Predicted cobalamin binding protein
MSHSASPRHPIGVVSERTGLTADVLRVWERRYSVVEPQRSAGGQRLYSDADIERLTLLNRATRGGHGISHVAALSNAKLEDLVRDTEEARASQPARFIPAGEPDTVVDQAFAFAEALDPDGLEALLRRNAARYGLVFFLDSIAAPLMRKMGDEWHAGRITFSQEHLATAVIQRVVSDLSPLLTAGEGNPTIVIATLEGERHANGALMAAATAASDGWRVIYLGPDLPAQDIAETAARTGARAVGVSMILSERKAGRAAKLQELEKKLPSRATLFVGGSASEALKRNSRESATVFISTMRELREALALERGKATP